MLKNTSLRTTFLLKIKCSYSFCYCHFGVLVCNLLAFWWSIMIGHSLNIHNFDCWMRTHGMNIYSQPPPWALLRTRHGIWIWLVFISGTNPASCVYSSGHGWGGWNWSLVVLACVKTWGGGGTPVGDSQPVLLGNWFWFTICWITSHMLDCSRLCPLHKEDKFHFWDAYSFFF